MPDSHAVRFVSSAPHMPPTCFTLRALPHRSPSAMKNTEAGIIISTDHRTFTVTSRPRKNAVTKHTAACQRAMGSSGKV